MPRLGRSSSGSSVALLAEGVDRNFHAIALVIVSTVALLAEGVDRNLCGGVPPRNGWRSPSSRRAWIEITSSVRTSGNCSGRPPCGGRG